MNKIGNFATKATSFNMEAMGIVSMEGNIYLNETAIENAVFQISVFCIINISNVTFQVNFYLINYNILFKNISTGVGCIILNSDINGTIDNMKIINLNSIKGPAFAFIDLRENLTLTNLYYEIDESVAEINRTQISMFWSAYLEITNFTVKSPSGMGVFYIQYQSTLILTNFQISDYKCTSTEKGCILSVLSSSVVNASAFYINEVTGKSSLFYLDSSAINAVNLTLNNIYINTQSVAFAMTCQISNCSVSFLKCENFFGGFLSSESSNIILYNIMLKNNIFHENESPSQISVLYLSQCYSLFVVHSSFQNIRTAADGGVRISCFN